MVLLPKTGPEPTVSLPDVDYELIRKVSGAMRPWLQSYYRPRVQGIERIPEGRALLVGIHSGGCIPADAFALGRAFYEHFDFRRSLQFLAHNVLWTISPKITRILEGIGAVKASPATGRELLERERAVMVYPGGAYEVYRPWWERNRIDWNGHMGYARLAVRTRTPIVPVPSIGAHEQFISLSRGLSLNRLFGLHRWIKRLEIMPLIWSFPGGLSIAGVFPFGYIPFPAQVTVRCLEPLELYNTTAGRALFRRNPKGDPEHLHRLHRMVQQVMQREVDELGRDRIPVLGDRPRWWPRRPREPRFAAACPA